jgi:hypothetical protein
LKDADLLDAFVALFKPIDFLVDVEPFLPACKQATDRSMLEELNARLPARFPKLYEQLILNYRWQSSTICNGYRLLANPQGTDLSGLETEMFRDKAMSVDLLGHGYIQFGFLHDHSYDPICFQTKSNTRSTSKSRRPIVHLDHEQILCNSRIKVIDTIADSFREFVLNHVSWFGNASSSSHLQER